MPEEVNNSSNTLRKLKQMNDRKEMLKGRLSFLQIHEQRNESRALHNSQQYEFHQFMHEELEKTREAKAEYLRQVLLKVQQTQEKAKQDRRKHKKNLSHAQETLRSSHEKDYRESKQQAVKIEESIKKMKNEEEEKKHQKYA